MITRPAVSIAGIVVTAILVGGMTFTGTLSDSDRSAPVMTAADLLPKPRLEIRWQRGELILEGHTQSRAHEESLLGVAAALYPNNSPVTVFEPLGLVPPHWIDSSIRALQLLAATDSATAALSADQLTVSGITSGDSDWQDQLDAMQSAWPNEISVSVNTLVVNADLDLPAICERAFANVDLGGIRFEESTAEFRTSAYPQLQRIIAFGQTCRDPLIAITGHTDASGDEAFNRQLSLARAAAVGEYLSQGGIDSNRLVVAGVGSAQPIADNETRYGRSLNRRIEFSLRSD